MRIKRRCPRSYGCTEYIEPPGSAFGNVPGMHRSFRNDNG